MINTNTIRAGSIATVLLQGEHKMLTGGTKGTERNPLLGRVTRDHRLVITLAGPDSYGNRYEDAPGDKPWFEWVRPGLVKHPVTGALYLAALPTSVRGTRRYLVDGRPATEAELATIERYKKSDKPPKFLTFALENAVNVEPPNE